MKLLLLSLLLVGLLAAKINHQTTFPHSEDAVEVTADTSDATDATDDEGTTSIDFSLRLRIVERSRREMLDLHELPEMELRQLVL